MTHPDAQIRADTEPLREAFEEHYGALLRLCVLLTRRRADAEDVAQEAFVRAAGRLAGIEPVGVYPYLRKTALNVWRNHLRRRVLERRVRLEPQDPWTAPGDAAHVWTAVVALPGRQRACVVLRFYEGLLEREIAEVLGCSVGTVKSQTSRALAKLRKELGDEDG